MHNSSVLRIVNMMLIKNLKIEPFSQYYTVKFTTLLGLIACKEPKTFQVCCIIAILYTDNTYKYVAGLESRKLLLAVISA